MESQDVVSKYLSELNLIIRRGCTAHLTTDGRLFFMNHETKTSSWLPPVESWNPGGSALPYGWELAKDKDGRTYFINHVNKTSTYECPGRKDEQEEEPPEPRDLDLQRDAQMGFGFVAGSEKPVIVRFVTEGGPSENKLMPGDQILKINGEDVVKAPRERVIELVRSCKHSVKLTVCQPHTTNGARKSALLSAAKKARLKNKPSRVRFAEGVVINGSPLYSPSPFESCVPFLPNVLKVYLENGQTKSFKYDSTTTIQDVLDALQEKLSIKCLDHFSLVVEHIKSIRRNKLTLLDPKDTLAKIAARPGAHHLRCLFRVVFVPKDAYDLLQNDPVAFEYLYVQCCNDVVQERFAPELKYDIALRLAALHVQQHALSSGHQGKLNIKAIERECGLERFVPTSLLETMKRKELRKLLSHFLKQNQALSAPGQKQLTGLQAKLHYLKIISELPSYGAKCFSTNLKDSTMETALLVSPKFGISQINSLRSTVPPVTLAHIEEASSIHVTKDDELSYAVELYLKNPDRESLIFSLEDRDTEEFVLLLRGYHRLLACRDLPVHWEVTDPWRIESAPCYHSRHLVQMAPWNYPPKGDASMEEPSMQVVDLAVPVPPYVPCDATLLRSSSRETFYQSTLSLTSSVDHNMNETQRISLASPQQGDARGLEDPPISPIDLHSVVSMEMLEDAGDEEQQDELTEAKNQEVIQRVSEMNRMVADAEDYLLEEKDDSYPEAPRDEEVDQPGVQDSKSKIKAADSLLLLTQVDDPVDQIPVELVSKSDTPTLGDNEASPSESDTDSLSTPNDSPLHSARIKDSPQLRTRNRTGSSFGLHSPDLLPCLDGQKSTDVMELMKQLQDNNDLLPFAEGTLYLDPDIIDLTMIPPPATPDSELPLGTPLGNPPMSFLDSGLLAKKANTLHKLEQKEETVDNGPVDTCRVVAELDHLCHALSELQARTMMEDQNLSESPEEPLTLSQLPAIEDIDTFIASVAVPPPPSARVSEFEQEEHDDIAAYIIPPPPCSSSSSQEQDEVIARFQRVAADMKRIMSSSDEGSNTVPHNSSNEGAENPSGSSNSAGRLNDRTDGNTKAQPLQIWTGSSMDSFHASSPETFTTMETLSLTSEGEFHSGDSSSGYETLTSSLNSYGEMATVQNDCHNKSIPTFSKEHTLCSDFPGENQTVEPVRTMTSFSEVIFQFPTIALNGHALGSNKSEEEKPQAPPRLRKESKGSFPTGPHVPDAKDSSTDDVEESWDVSPQMTSSVSWGQLPKSNSPTDGKKLKPMVNGRSQKPPLPPSSPSADRARKALKAANNALNIAQGSPGGPRLSSQGSSGGSSPESNHLDSSPRGSISSGCMNGFNGLCSDSLNNNLEDDESPLQEPVSSPFIEMSCDADDGSSVRTISNGFIRGLMNGVADYKMRTLNLNSHKYIASALLTGKLIAERPLVNGYSVEGVDVDSQDRFSSVLKDIKAMVFHLDTVSQTCLQNEETLTADSDQFVSVKEALMAESRQFVTASKLFVKSATEASDKVDYHLITCVHLLDRIFAISELMLLHMENGLQVTSLVEKLKEVALAYSNTVNAAQQTVDKNSSNPDMCTLMHQATALATALTTLMRTLRTFATP